MAHATETNGFDPTLDENGNLRELPEGVEIVDGVPTVIEKPRTIGPTLAFGIPHPIVLELEKIFEPKFTMGIGLGGLSLPYTKDGTKLEVGIFGLDAKARWHPWGGSFFLGAALGVQSIYGKASESIPVPNYGTFSADIEAAAISGYLTPHLGWLAVWKSGFTLGFELGYQWPFSAKTELKFHTNDATANDAIAALQATQKYQDLYKKVDDAGRVLGKVGLPYLTVLRIGWMF